MFIKILSKLFITVFFCLISFNILQAAPDMYVSDIEGGTAKDFIDLNTTPTPWLYYQLPYAGKTFATFLWTSSTNNYFSIKTTNLVNLDTIFWYKFDEFTYTDENDVDHTWADVKQTGLWYIDADYSKKAGVPGHLDTQVTFTPEPISSALFILGGVVLGVKQYKKRKKDSI